MIEVCVASDMDFDRSLKPYLAIGCRYRSYEFYAVFDKR